uniref:Serine-threonine/tyrosine-protein kinase catalytic domain-containing protein n=1 Tax=Physcomitrium patens TaxID=3218 RepID=A0A2K1KF04_PHYPA|nr:hypothetical protein PHYPA_008738 [Physcomitrium patens]
MKFYLFEADVYSFAMFIEKCWKLNPFQQPKFESICDRLINLKKLFLIGSDIA